MKLRLLQPVTISFLVIVLLIAAISIFSSPQSVSAQDEMTATVTETAFVPPTVPYFTTMTTTVTATVTTFPVVTSTPTVTATVTDKPTVTFTPTQTQKPTLTYTPTATATMRPTITATATATVQTFIVSGALGVKGAGATVWYSGGFTIADSWGNYSFSIPSGWEGVITPTKTGYRFLPGSIAITSPVYANLPNQNFTTKPSNK